MRQANKMPQKYVYPDKSGFGRIANMSKGAFLVKPYLCARFCFQALQI